jgi:hypothetical protein
MNLTGKVYSLLIRFQLLIVVKYKVGRIICCVSNAIQKQQNS